MTILTTCSCSGMSAARPAVVPFFRSVLLPVTVIRFVVPQVLPCIYG